MKIAYIAAGAAGMYCGTCLHDNALAAALLDRGHEVALIPTYTPLRTDDRDVSIEPVFYGGVNVYLREKLPRLALPAFLRRWLDRPALLDRLSRYAASTEARELGAMTLSVLRGEEGRQRQELSRLVEWLAEFRPDVVQLTNCMFLGTAGAIKERLGVPVVCGLTGEDIFLDDLEEPYKSRVEAELRRRAADADAFVTSSRYYAAEMQRYLAVESERMHTIPLGISLAGFPTSPRTSDGDGLTVGYLARVCPAKGLHVLLGAFQRLVEDLGVDARLRVAGYVGPGERRYLDEQRRRVAAWGLEERVEFLGEVDRAGKLELLASLDLLSVPTVYRESKGLFVLEALAAGVPVVLPDHGAFPELIERTGGGVLVAPSSQEALAAALAGLAGDAHRRNALGAAGHAAVHRDLHDGAMAERTEALFASLLPNAAQSTVVPRSDPVEVE